ncbi:CBS domain-containing protein [Hydromonas duriensis]|uniref:CBS domain protein n=1 Tax=Hydromonas duriensis TaxID=1527608 RepID=A0A4R6Y800_9BURK|nr:CBS domain-containing protein [Hydromonas duriensis]TDR31497.1 CBS domain protein [Hydromonas duriensis]
MSIDHYPALTEVNLKGVAVYAQPPHRASQNVTLTSHALEVMTDFHYHPAVTIQSDIPIDDANAKMIAFGVRSLLVTNNKQQIIGIITSTDILGEKPMKVLQERGGRHADICVFDVMTCSDKLFFVHFDDLKNAKVGHLLQTLKQSGRQHTLVLEEDSEGNEIIRGIVSAAQIARQLGIAHHAEVARTFMEVEKALR